MSGRHRAPSQTQYARDFAVIATATTAAVTPWLLPTSTPQANAATTEQWNKVAQCESSLNWKTNTGNDYFGGLQFLQSTWQEFGGLEFAARADLATPAQQIRIAERVLKVQGKGAWPVCGRGLSSASSTTDTNREPESNSTATRPKPELPQAPTTPPSGNASSFYTVAPGDTLSAIASRFSTTTCALAKLNKIDNPDLIYAGARLRITPGVVAPSSNPAQIKPNSSSSTNSSPTLTTRATKLVRAARGYLGVPYLYGGNSSKGLDCSGLVQQSFRKIGISTPRTADLQMRASRSIAKSQLAPGDLLFSVDSSGHAYHVVIYVGNGQIVDAQKPGKVVVERSMYPSLTRFGRLL